MWNKFDKLCKNIGVWLGISNPARIFRDEQGYFLRKNLNEHQK